MQARVDPEGWVVSEGVPRFILIQIASAIVMDGIGAALFLAYPPIADMFPRSVGVAAVAVLVVLGLAGIAWLAQTLWPQAVRASTDGIEIRRRWGGSVVVPWSESTLTPDPRSPSGTGHQILRWRNPEGTRTGMVLLTGSQSIAVRSSPHRPMTWSGAPAPRPLA